LKEIEILKKKRDWIFNERDKVLKERESIRGLCDDLRHQRDKAISELAEALRQVDEIQKQNSSAYQQIYKLEYFFWSMFFAAYYSVFKTIEILNSSNSTLQSQTSF